MNLDTKLGGNLPPDSEVFILKRRSFTTDFKREAAGLVLDQNYTVSQASEAVNIRPSLMRRWVQQLRLERGGVTPISSPAMTPEQQRIQELEAKIRKIEREKAILKKATALLMSDSLDHSH